MKVLLNNKTIEVSDELVKAINEQQKVNDAINILPNFGLIKDIKDFTRNELLSYANELEILTTSNNGAMEYQALENLSYDGDVDSQ